MNSNKENNSNNNEKRNCIIQISIKELIGYIVFIVLLSLVLIIHILCINDKKKSIHKNHYAKLDSLSLSFAYRPLVIDSFILDTDILESNNTKKILDTLNKFNQSQFNKLINEVNKNSLQFNKIADSAEDRLSRELNNLNLWVTIWIGLFSIFSIIFQISTHYFTKKEIEKEIQSFQEVINKKEIELDLMKVKIEKNNALFEIFTIQSILKELSGQTTAFFDNDDRNIIINDLLSGATSKMRCIFQNEDVLYDNNKNQFNYTFKFLFREIKITMYQIQTYYNSRKIIESIQEIINLSDDILRKIDQTTIKNKIDLLPSLFDRLTELLNKYNLNSPSTT